MSKKFYVVINGRNPGTYNTWDECKDQVNGFPSAKYKGFKTQTEAESYIKESTSNECNNHFKIAPLPNLNNGFKPLDKEVKVCHPQENYQNYNSSIKPNTSSVENQKTSCYRNFNTSNQPLKLSNDNTFKSQPSQNGEKYKNDFQKNNRKRMHGGSENKEISNKYSRSNDFQNISVQHPTTLNLLADPNDPSRVCVYTDGSCKKVQRGRNIAGFGVYWGKDCPLNVARKYEGVQTNNRAEIAAVINAVETAATHGIKKLLIATDSQFTINCMTKWIKTWKKKNWIISTGKEAECRDVLEKLDNLIISTNIDMKWIHIKAHNGHFGNEAADKLANEGANQWMKR